MKVVIKYTGLVIGIILISLSLFGQNKDFQKANAAAQSYVKKRANKGMVVGIIQNGKTKVLSYGNSSSSNKKAPDGNTLFEIGGVTSVFTTTLTKLEEKGEVFKMEDFIQDHLREVVRVPTFRPEICFEHKITSYPMTPGDPGRDYVVCMPMPMSAAGCITFCHLASHTAGFPNTPKGIYSWNPIKKNKQKKDPYVDFSKKELYQNMEKVFIDYKPGSVFDYSNWGIAIMGNLVADIANQPYETLLTERLLTPLVLMDTRVSLSVEQQARLATGHDHKGRVTDHWHMQSMAPAIGLKSSASDLLVFLQANLNTKNVDLENAFAHVQQAKIDTYEKRLGRTSSMGYGWFTSRLNEATNMPIQWVSGGTSGFRSFIAFNKDTQTGVVVLSNSANDVDEIGFLFLEGLIGTERTSKSIAELQLKK